MGDIPAQCQNLEQRPVRGARINPCTPLPGNSQASKSATYHEAGAYYSLLNLDVKQEFLLAKVIAWK